MWLKRKSTRKGGGKDGGSSLSASPENQGITWPVRDGSQNAVELGHVTYLNLSPDGAHGEYELAVKAIATQPTKPLFVNFVEWSG